MKRKISRKPPTGAPEGIVWFGGPVDRWSISLRVYGEQLDPGNISEILGCDPTSSERKGARGCLDDGAPIPRTSHWLLGIESKNFGEQDDVDGIRMLLERLPSAGDLWASLTSTYNVDVFCGVYMETWNRGFGISPEVSRMLSDRNLEVEFDKYFDPPK